MIAMAMLIIYRMKSVDIYIFVIICLSLHFSIYLSFDRLYLLMLYLYILSVYRFHLFTNFCIFLTYFKNNIQVEL